jgi:Transglutaminase-like superfamily
VLLAPPVTGAEALSYPSQGLLFRLAALAALIAVVGIAFYFQLPYRSGWITQTTLDEVGAAPTPDFKLGSVEWTVSGYATDPALAPFRSAFQATCGNRRGIPAAICISDTMARRFPYGSPSTEFTDRSFDPVAHLSQHATGEPGHCMNRVAIMAAELLSVGIPARVTQLLPMHGPGHNVVEVWDEGNGWVVVDPTYGTVLGDGRRPIGAVVLRGAPEHVPWHTLAEAPAPKNSFEDGRRNGPDTRLYKGQLFYPEPWLYLRTGERVGRWPFRGAFARLSTGRLDVGRILFLRAAIAVSFVVAVVLLLSALRVRRREAVTP